MLTFTFPRAHCFVFTYLTEGRFVFAFADRVRLDRHLRAHLRGAVRPIRTAAGEQRSASGGGGASGSRDQGGLEISQKVVPPEVCAQGAKCALRFGPYLVSGHG